MEKESCDSSPRLKAGGTLTAKRWTARNIAEAICRYPHLSQTGVCCQQRPTVALSSTRFHRRICWARSAIAAVSTCVSSGCQSFRLGISRNPVSETMQGMYQILDGK